MLCRSLNSYSYAPNGTNHQLGTSSRSSEIRSRGVQVYLAEVRGGINNNRWHPYSIVRRVWAQRPLDDA